MDMRYGVRAAVILGLAVASIAYLSATRLESG